MPWGTIPPYALPRVEAVVERAIRIQPGDSAPGDAIYRGESSADDDLTVGLQSDCDTTPRACNIAGETRIGRPVCIKAAQIARKIGLASVPAQHNFPVRLGNNGEHVPHIKSGREA